MTLDKEFIYYVQPYTDDLKDFQRKVQRMKKLAIYGAFDRFNYGDLLFPLILESTFAELQEDFEIVIYGTVESDLSNYGARPTKSIEDLFNSDSLKDGSVLVLGGGDILGAKWFEIFGYLIPYSLSNFHSLLKRQIPKNYLSKMSLKLNSSELPFPFVISPKDFRSKIKVIYNAVGATSLQSGNYSLKTYFQLFEKLNQANYLSVRDKKSRDFLVSLSNDLKIRLVPDSATVLSKVFPQDTQINLAKPEIRSWIQQHLGKYVVLQIAQKYCHKEEKIKAISQQIEKIFLKHQLMTVLCPIGMATDHEDFIPLNSIRQQVTTPILYLDNPSIFDIMAMIANSRIFVGTSLHGAITAMSYSVPNLAFKMPNHKVQDYLDTWALEELRRSITPEEICSAIEDAINLPKEKLERKKDDLINASLVSLSEMKAKILSDNYVQSQPDLSVSLHSQFILVNRIIGLLAKKFFYRIKLHLTKSMFSPANIFSKLLRKS